jgi:hypothetical protein
MGIIFGFFFLGIWDVSDFGVIFEREINDFIWVFWIRLL